MFHYFSHKFGTELAATQLIHGSKEHAVPHRRKIDGVNVFRYQHVASLKPRCDLGSAHHHAHPSGARTGLNEVLDIDTVNLDPEPDGIVSRLA